MRAKPEKIRPVANLQEFFKDSVADAMEKQGVAADDHTAYYVVNLLTLFARAEKLYTALPEHGAPRGANSAGLPRSVSVCSPASDRDRA